MATYYVATTGNDTTGNGSAGTPWLTLTKAESSASDGDTVNVGAGIFQEATYLTVAKQITWVGAGRGITFIRGNNTSRVIYLNSTKTKTFTGFSIDGSSSGSLPAYHVEGGAANQATTFSNCGFINGKTTTLRLNSGMSGVTLDGCTITANTESQIVHVLGGAGGFTLNNCTIDVPLGLTMNGVIYMQTAVTSGVVTITNCNISCLSNYALIRMAAGGYTNMVITDNVFTVGTNNTRTIVDILNVNGTGTFSRNTVNVPGVLTTTLPVSFRSTVGTGPNCVWTVEDNIIYTHNADNYGILMGDEGGDITSKANAFDGSTIRGNQLYFAPYYGLSIGSAHAIMMGGNKNLYVENNYVYGAAYAAACKGYSEAWTAGYIRNNVFVNCTYPVRMKGQSSIRCVNNVIYNNGSMVGTSLAITENGVGEDSDNAFLRNNLVIRDADKAYEFSDTSFATLDADYQCFYLTGTATMGTKFPAASYSTLAEWQAGAVQDLNSISGNPVVDADYVVNAASICFETGIPVTGVTKISDTTLLAEITLGGNAALVTHSPYKKRSQVS